MAEGWLVENTEFIHLTTLGKRCNVSMPMGEGQRGKRDIILRIKEARETVSTPVSGFSNEKKERGEKM
jgi:hypothetical protein